MTTTYNTLKNLTSVQKLMRDRADLVFMNWQKYSRAFESDITSLNVRGRPFVVSFELSEIKNVVILMLTLQSSKSQSVCHQFLKYFMLKYQ